LKEERRLRVFENWVLSKILGRDRNEVTREVEEAAHSEFCSLYYSWNIILVIKYRIMRRVGHVTRMGEGRGTYRVVVGRPE
jgi:hypothetical protein